jgi:small-conductance mechanosensitive channel
VRYTLIFLGLLVGLSAAGVELSKLTVIVRGLGVGIGFGLQNVVNNFVSGLILLFERPIQVAYFVNFGDSALEFKLRVWSELTDAGYPLRSELAVAVQEALEHAGIGVPFPQRDLHLVSVSPDAAPDLSTATQPSPRPNPASGSDEES